MTYGEFGLPPAGSTLRNDSADLAITVAARRRRASVNLPGSRVAWTL